MSHKSEYKSPDGKSEQEIFLAALQIGDPPERAKYLDSACGSDLQLRRSIEQLLQEEETAGDFLETPAITVPRAEGKKPGPDGTSVIERPTEKLGEKIGRYKLLQNIGEGGCGSVYMAEQQEPIRRRVALKIIKLGMDTRQVIARFEAERQALAMMEHPNIAKVLDAGATEQGRPFFVMELVRGIKITDYADQNHLSTEDRLKLFIQVCNAIQHAHQKGIIHRDIKPSNILVTLHDGTPIPKVIDFGVAKATNQQRLTDKTLFTAFEQFIGTPAYMSPEQAEMSGLDIDTRTDVYSLGVLLYELLTGKPPFDPDRLMRGGLDECRRTLRQDEPERPSNRLATMIASDLTTVASSRSTEPPRLLTLLRGDLDWVVMMCLEKDRARRYATVNALAVDVQRYLDGEPVTARPPSGVYRFQKFARRYQAPLAAAAAILLTIVTGSAISIWQAIRATQAERDAHQAQIGESSLRRRAETGWDRAREQTLLAKLNEYVADMNLAQQSLTAGNYGRAVQLLEKHRPVNGAVDFRGFEWRYLWNVSRGDEHISLPDQGGPVVSVAFSPKADLLASALFEKVNVYDPRTRNLLATLPKGASSLAFSPDARRLYTAGMASVRVWDTASWTELRQMDEHSGPLALSADGSLFAACGRGGVRVWDTQDWAQKAFLKDASGPLVFSPDGKRLAADRDEGITIFDIASRRPGPVLQDSTNLFPRSGPRFWGDRLLAFSPDGKTIAAPRNQQSAKGVFVVALWDTESGKELAVMPDDPEHIEHTGVISSIVFSEDGGSLATGSLDHSVRIWDLSSRKPRQVVQGHLHEVWAIAMTPDGQMLASGARDGGLKLWNARQQEKEDALAGAYLPLGFSSDSRYLAALAGNDRAVFINLTSQEPEREFALSPVRRRPPGSVSISADQKVLAEGLEDGNVKLWNTLTRESTSLKVSERMPGLLAILAPDGNTLLTGGFGQPLKLWDLGKGESTALGVQGHRALFSPDGKTLAVLDRGNSVGIWDVAARTLRTNIVMDPAPGFSAVFSPDGRMLAVTSGRGSVEDEIRLWDVARGRLLGTCMGHKQGVFSLAFSPDGRTLASASDDSTVKLWNVATRQELLSVRRLGGGLSSLIFSPDGRWLVGSRGFGRQPAELRFHFAPTLKEIESASKADR